jgi:hypothetical protein
MQKIDILRTKMLILNIFYNLCYINTMDNKGWTNKNETEVQSWIQVCNQYVSGHNDYKIYYKKKSSVFIILSIIMSAIITILGGISSVNNVKILNIILTIISGISMAMNAYLEKDSPNQKMMKHNDAVTGYKQIIINIKCQLGIEKKNREECTDFMRSTMEEMNKLECGEESISIIPKNVVNMLNKEYDNKKAIIVVVDNEETNAADNSLPNVVDNGIGVGIVDQNNKTNAGDLSPKDTISDDTSSNDVPTPVVAKDNKIPTETEKKFEIFFRNNNVSKYLQENISDKMMNSYQIDRLNRQ